MARGISDQRKPEFDRAGALFRIARHDRNALKCLYHDVSPHLLGLLLTMVKAQAVAEEILQDTFVAIWKTAHEFDAARQSADVWLYTIGRRKALARLYGVAEWSADKSASGLDDTLYGSTKMEPRIVVGHWIDSLAPEIRRAIILYFIAGLARDAVAAELGVSQIVADGWLRKGLAELDAIIAITVAEARSTLAYPRIFYSRR